MKSSFFFVGLCLISMLAGCAQKAPITDRQPAEVAWPPPAIQDFLSRDAREAKSAEHAARFYDQGHPSERAVLVIHGLHESPKYMEGVARYFFEKGDNVLSIRLPGHMTPQSRDLTTMTAQAWIQRTDEAYALLSQLGHQRILSGYSTGGLLVTRLGLQHPEQIRMLFLMAPALDLTTKIRFSGNWGQFAGMTTDDICNDRQCDLCRRLMSIDDQLLDMLDEGIPSSPNAGATVIETINQTIRELGPRRGSYKKRLEETFAALKVPAFVVNSAADSVVLVPMVQKIFQRWSGKKQAVLAPLAEKIKHTDVNKTPLDVYRHRPKGFNPHYQEIFRALDEFDHEIP